MVKTSYEYLKIVEQSNGMLQVIPVWDLYNSVETEEKYELEKEIEILNDRIGLGHKGLKSEYIIL